MNIRYSKLFKTPRKAIKHVLSAVYPVIIKIWPLPKVLSIDETLDKIIAEKLSIARFGDGEFLYMIDKLNLPFQKQESLLRKKLIGILKSDEPNVLVGLPIGYHSLRNLNKESLKTWRSQISWIYPRLKKHLDLSKPYYNASMTRLYMDYEDKSDSSRLFTKVMQIWEGRHIALIEGEKSRLGAGNNLFENAASVVRILGPAHNAYDKFQELLQEAQTQPKHKLFLVAMGPTAKPLVFELARQGFQAIDIGNVDIEYEWYLRGATEKIKIPGKYTSEAPGGRNVEDIVNEAYENQIIARVY
ncbi:MAG TPA: GT-D fold domain-containing glycosyltransferase [Bacteroidales bacterium]|nr:GT-D fold domain-containing glycosyltransferase [Bacteroidales bacterium]